MAKRTQTSIENNLTDPAQLHTEILQIAEENKDIIEAVDNYRERWKTVFPNGMLEELCVEFRCCPSMIFILLQAAQIFLTVSSVSYMAGFLDSITLYVIFVAARPLFPWFP